MPVLFLGSFRAILSPAFSFFFYRRIHFAGFFFPLRPNPIRTSTSVCLFLPILWYVHSTALYAAVTSKVRGRQKSPRVDAEVLPRWSRYRKNIKLKIEIRIVHGIQRECILWIHGKAGWNGRWYWIRKQNLFLRQTVWFWGAYVRLCRADSHWDSG